MVLTKKQKNKKRREYYRKNRERIREYHRKWREANPDKTKKYSRNYYTTPKGIQNRKKNQIKYYWNHVKEKRRYAKERWRMKHNKCLECGSKEITYTRGSTNYKPINSNIWGDMYKLFKRMGFRTLLKRKSKDLKIKEGGKRRMVTIHEVECWDWIECLKCGMGQRANPKLMKEGTPFCQECDVEMIIKECPK